MAKRDQNWVLTGKDRDEAYKGIFAGVGMIALGIIGLAEWGFVWWFSGVLVLVGVGAILGSRARLSGEV